MADETSERIKKRRSELGISLQKLEELTGISRSTLQRYETISTAKVGIDKLSKIAEALQVIPTYLMGWESKDLPYSEYKCIIPLLEELTVSIEYDNKTELFILKYDTREETISYKEILHLKEAILNYTQFLLSKNDPTL